MEYCVNVFENERNRKRFARVAYRTLAVMCIFGMACELPALEEEAVPVVNESTEGGAYRTPATGDHISLNGKTGVKLPKRSLLESVNRLRYGDQDVPALIMPPSPGRYDEWTESLFDFHTGTDLPKELLCESGTGTEITIPNISGADILPGISENNTVPDYSTESEQPVVPSIPEHPANPDGSDDTAAPDLPEIPEYPVLPDHPSVPDTPESPDIPDHPAVPDAPDTPAIPDDPAEPEIPDGESDVEVDPLAGFQVNEEGLIYALSLEEAGATDGYLELPAEGCTGILSSAFTGLESEITEISIPANITYIEEGALSKMTNLFGIWVDEGNPGYTCMEGVLFDKDVTTLLTFPSGRIGVYNMPASVTRLADYALMGTRLNKIEMRACQLIEVGGNVFGQGSGNGLVIFAPSEYLAQYQEIFAGFDVVVR